MFLPNGDAVEERRKSGAQPTPSAWRALLRDPGVVIVLTATAALMLAALFSDIPFPHFPR